MIASATLDSPAPINAGQAKQDFLTLRPVVERYAQVAFRHLPWADREEAVAEAVAAAFQSYLSLTRRGKDPFQFPTVIAIRAAQHVRSGRCVGGKLRRRDVFFGTARQHRGLRRRNLLLMGDWAEALEDNRHTPIPDQVSFRCDFPRWLQTLSDRDRRIADLLALGHSTKATAKRFGLSEGRISQLRRQMHESWQGFHGEETVPTDARPIATA
jgi:DNA-binding NarL/FixJ family response regulator